MSLSCFLLKLVNTDVLLKPDLSSLSYLKLCQCLKTHGNTALHPTLFQIKLQPFNTTHLILAIIQIATITNKRLLGAPVF